MPAGKVKGWMVANLARAKSQRCPCGLTRRAFLTPDNPTVSVHLVDIKAEAEPHYHKRLTEAYFILEGRGHVELDGERVPVKPMTAVLIKPLCRHRAVGKLRIVNVVVPAFDEADEWFDE
jgi:mannose-6-phosphate isomerase-like protein (cupin superfamily)